MRDWITFLVTGPDDNLLKFNAPVEFFDRRGQTCRCRAHDWDGDNGQRCFNVAIEAAKAADVTIQDLNEVGTHNARTHILGGGATCTVSDCKEEYPVRHLGSHGMKWPPTKDAV
jgi:hypothetical protein